MLINVKWLNIRLKFNYSEKMTKRVHNLQLWAFLGSFKGLKYKLKNRSTREIKPRPKYQFE